jgi:hypothetical protein
MKKYLIALILFNFMIVGYSQKEILVFVGENIEISKIADASVTVDTIISKESNQNMRVSPGDTILNVVLEPDDSLDGISVIQRQRTTG